MSPGVGPSKEKFVGALFVCLYREDFSVGLLNIWMLVIVLQMESLMWCKCSKFKQDFFFSISWKTVKFKLVEQHGSWNENVSSNKNVSSNRFGIEISFVWQQCVSFMIFLICTISFNHFSIIYDHYISSSHNYNSERRGVLFKQ